MLERLHEIDWSQLPVGYGMAPRMPEILTALARGDEPQAEDAFYALCNALDNGVPDEATFTTIPFLIEILADPETGGKVYAVGMLWIIANHWLWFVERGAVLDPHAGGKRAYDMIFQGLPTYIPLLAHADSQVRIDTAMLLSSFHNDAIPCIHALVDSLESEQDENVYATILWSFHRLTTYGTVSSTARDRLLQIGEQSMNHDSPLVRFSAAMLLLDLKGDSVDDAPVTLLIQALHRLQTLPQLPWDGVVEFDACSALSKLGTERAVQAFIHAMAGVQETRWLHEVVDALLYCIVNGKQSRPRRGRYRFGTFAYSIAPDGLNQTIYGDKRKGLPHPPTPALTNELRIAIRAILDCELWWTEHTNLLSCHGLPDSREELQALLQ